MQYEKNNKTQNCTAEYLYYFYKFVRAWRKIWKDTFNMFYHLRGMRLTIKVLKGNYKSFIIGLLCSKDICYYFGHLKIFKEYYFKILDSFEIQKKSYYFPCVFLFQKERDKLAYMHTIIQVRPILNQRNRKDVLLKYVISFFSFKKSPSLDKR